MRALLLVCFLSCAFISSSQSERDLINQIDSINSLALLHFNNNQIVESFNAFNESKKLSELINDSYGKAISSLHLGNIYKLMQEYDKAEGSYNAMLKAAKEINDNFLIANAYLNLGELKKTQNKSQLALSYFEDASTYIAKKDFLEDCNHEENECQELLLKTRINLCETHLEGFNLEQALINLLRLEDIIANSKTPNSTYFKNYFDYLYGTYFVKKGLYNNANEKFKAIITSLDKRKIADNKYDVSLLLSKVYEAKSITSYHLGDDNEAYLSLLDHNIYKNEFLNHERVKYEVVTKSKFLIEDYKNNAQLANTEKLHQLQIANNVKIINTIITVAFVLLIICLLAVYKSYVSNRKLNLVLKTQNKELEITKNEAVKSSDLKSKFISNVTHELRTPLYGVVGITSLLLRNNSLSERDSKLLASLKYSGDYLLNLVNEVLQFGKIESQQVELKNVSVNIRELINNHVNSFDYRLQETNNKIEVFIDKNVPNFIKCDQVRLSQVLINLIGNSIKFTESGRICLRVKTLELQNNKASLRFEVEDNGIGIPREKFDTIFDNFSQLDDNTNFNYQGTGLGLSITKKIVELFESTIELESEEGSGSKFSFNVTFDIDTEVKPVIATKIVKGKMMGLKNKYQILVAEDNKINQIVTRNLLEKENYHCVIVNNGEEALKAIKNQTFDLILMDINMPVMNGVEATKIIRNFDFNTPILALTASDIEYVKEKYDGIGFSGIITKPFDNYEFFQMIETNIQQSKKYKNTLEKVS